MRCWASSHKNGFGILICSLANILLLWQHLFLRIDALSSSNPTVSPLTSTKTRRLGKSSFIHKQKNGSLPSELASAAELQELVAKNSNRQRGSSNYIKAWRHWRELAIVAIRQELSTILPYPVEDDALAQLSFALGVAADHGAMPSFEHPGARAGYALDFFCRARLLADFLMDIDNPTFPSFWRDDIVSANPLFGIASAREAAQVQVTSLGGGPGFDFVAAALVSAFTSTTSPGSYQEPQKVPTIHTTVLDYEEGWGDLVGAMTTATKDLVPQSSNLSCDWGGHCDITKSLHDPSNSKCLELMTSTSVWVCQYCVAENAQLLRNSDFIFFREIWENMSIGSVMIITETTPRLWPEFVRAARDVAKDKTAGLKVGFPNHKGPHLVIYKTNPSLSDEEFLSPKDLNQLESFKKISDRHEARLQSGWERQGKKNRSGYL